ncbi:hypothetical protein [Paenibacillus sp. YAF4_2]
MDSSWKSNKKLNQLLGLHTLRKSVIASIAVVSEFLDLNPLSG